MSKESDFFFGSMLSYTRSINPTRGFWYNLTVDGKKGLPVDVVESSFTGSLSNYIADKDMKKGKGTNVDAVNLQRGDAAYLASDSHGFLFQFGFSVTANSLRPSGCNRPEGRQGLIHFTEEFAMSGGYHSLARRYVAALFSGHVLWRNDIAHRKTVSLSYGDGRSLVVNIDALTGLGRLPTLDEIAQHTTSGDVEDFVTSYEKALSMKGASLIVNVEITGRLPAGHEIYPSQEFIIDEAAKKAKSKHLDTAQYVAEDGTVHRQAASHPQKIGNALRCIDTWYADDAEPLAVEVYGFSRDEGVAARLGKATDKNASFYNLLTGESVERMLSTLGTPQTAHAEYFVACLIRGGVYGKSDKKDAA